MSRKGIFNSKFINEYYIKQSENEIKKLEEKANEYNKKIEEEELKLKNNSESFEKLKNDNESLKVQYEELIGLIRKRGILLDLKRGNFEISEWDNLAIAKLNGKAAVVTKKGEKLELWDESALDLLDEIMKITDNYSIVVVRIIGNRIKAQLRI